MTMRMLSDNAAINSIIHKRSNLSEITKKYLEEKSFGIEEFNFPQFNFARR